MKDFFYFIIVALFFATLTYCIQSTYLADYLKPILKTTYTIFWIASFFFFLVIVIINNYYPDYVGYVYSLALLIKFVAVFFLINSYLPKELFIKIAFMPLLTSLLIEILFTAKILNKNEYPIKKEK